MSSFTNFLNLFKWNAIEDGEEEFNIDKALNENWDKIDIKLETHIKGVNKEVSDFKTNIKETLNDFETNTNKNVQDFKTEVNNGINTFQQQTNKKVQDLADSISSTQVFHRYKLVITEDTTIGAEILLPCNYKVGQDVLDVYLNGQKLSLSSNEAGIDGHYIEVGETDHISNKIKTTTDWNLEIGDILELVVRGEYNDTDL